MLNTYVEVIIKNFCFNLIFLLLQLQRIPTDRRMELYSVRAMWYLFAHK